MTVGPRPRCGFQRYAPAMGSGSCSGRDEHPPLGTAIAASCAIPLLLRPVRIGRHRYIDGATHSPTNADLLVGAGVEVAIVIAPMSGRSEALRHRPDHAGAGRVPLADCARKRNNLFTPASTSTSSNPTPQDSNALGINAVDRSRTVRVVPHAFMATGSQIDPSLTAVLRGQLPTPDLSNRPGTPPAVVRCRRPGERSGSSTDRARAEWVIAAVALLCVSRAVGGGSSGHGDVMAENLRWQTEMAREARAGPEFAAFTLIVGPLLALSPRGDGHAVLVLPDLRR